VSAFDVAGAVTWTPLALMGWWWLFTEGNRPSASGEKCAAVLSMTLLSSFGGCFCIARLFGASL
jgi:hypothetical protein